MIYIIENIYVHTIQKHSLNKLDWNWIKDIQITDYVILLIKR